MNFNYEDLIGKTFTITDVNVSHSGELNKLMIKFSNGKNCSISTDCEDSQSASWMIINEESNHVK